MASKTKIEVFGNELRVLLDSEMSGTAQSRYLAAVAREELAKAQAINRAALGRVPLHDTYVDGRHNAALETVRPNGEIVFEFELMEEPLNYIAELLIKNSPVGQPGDPRPGHPGLYRNSHIFVVDGNVHPPGAPLPIDWSEAYFANTVPYARKIERGLSDQAPDGVYQGVAILARRRFNNFCWIGFGYRSLIVGGIQAWAARTGMESPYRRGQMRDDWLRRQPAVILAPYEGEGRRRAA